jgi:hypothetical protein
VSAYIPREEDDELDLVVDVQSRGPVRRILHAAGIDRAIAFTVVGRGWAMVSGLVSAFVITAFLTSVQQGYWYTFGSILGLQVFFELGLTTVILQFASHERAHLEWTSDRRLAGDERIMRRLASVLRLALVWYGVAAVLLVVAVVPAGWWFFTTHEQGDVVWQLPWVLLGVTTAGVLFVSPILAILEGCGCVAEVALLRTVQAILGSLTVWFALAAGLKLYSVALTSTVTLVFAVAWLFIRYRRWFAALVRREPGDDGVGWRSEIWPFQWRIAVSWLSGFFIFQLFTPVLFAYQGAVVAGQMGMSISLAGAVGAMAMAWMSTKSPAFGMLVARRCWTELDHLFFRSAKQSFVAVSVGAGAAWGFIAVLTVAGLPMSERVLALLPLALLLGATVVNQIVFCEAIYLRAHKKEPFMWLSVVNGICIGLSTWLLGRYAGAVGVVAGYLLLSATLGLGGGTWIFWNKRREWHRAEVT